MVRWKKMNKDSKKFIKYVKRIIPIHSKDKREFILLLSQRIKEFSDDLERCTYEGQRHSETLSTHGAPSAHAHTAEHHLHPRKRRC